jgi:colanic acid biosynthesis glycosyl transferase WcaI
VEIVVAAAEALRLESGIQFAIVGDGAERARIESLIVTAGLTNVTMVPHQPYAAVPAIYGASHVCLVLQASGTGASVLPSKAVQIAGAGRPLLAVCDAGSDLAGFVTSTGVGLVVPPGRPDLLAGGVKQMQNDYASWSGRAQASRLEVRDAYSVEHIAGAYSRLIQRLVDRAQR